MSYFNISEQEEQSVFGDWVELGISKAARPKYVHVNEEYDFEPEVPEADMLSEADFVAEEEAPSIKLIAIESPECEDGDTDDEPLTHTRFDRNEKHYSSTEDAIEDALGLDLEDDDMVEIVDDEA